MTLAGEPIRLLILDDSAADAELEQHELRRAGLVLESRLAAGRDEYVAALATFSPQLVIADFTLPDMDGLEAIALARQHDADLPVVIVTGSLDEATAVECMKAGAADYLLKDRIRRLPSSVLAALERCRLAADARRAQQELRRERDLLDAIFASIPVMIVFLDASGRILLMNREVERVLGWTLADGQQPDFFDKVYPDPAYRSLALEMSRASDGVWREVKKRARDGSDHDVAWMNIRLDGRGTSLGIGRDITEQKRAEESLRSTREQLLQSQKLEAVGQLAGGIAHDFNNLLGVILGQGEMLAPSLAPGSKDGERLDQMLDAAERAAQLTRQLLTFSRKEKPELRPLRLDQLVRDTERLLARVIGEHIEVRLSTDVGLGSILGDPNQIGQILLNLAVNARDAMPQGGRLSIDLANREIDERGAADVPAGRYVLLSVSDTGCGMDEATRARIFEPFFTTKPAGRGTGLGLATVYGIVTGSGGHIRVESAPARGTCFRIYLPRASGATELAEAAPAAPPRGRGERVLVVEDEEGLLELVSELLESLGYGVQGVREARSALAILARPDERVDLLLTDVVMPGLGGPELAREASRLRPGLHVLFTSGHDEAMLSERGVPQSRLLRKPFSQDELAWAVRRAFEG